MPAPLQPNEIKNCPCCSGRAFMRADEHGFNTKPVYWIYCEACEMRSAKYFVMVDATTAWNRRPDETVREADRGPSVTVEQELRLENEEEGTRGIT